MTNDAAPPRTRLAWLVSWLVGGSTMLLLDIPYLTLVAVPIFEEEAPGLLAGEPQLVAAGLFYVMYVTAVVVWANHAPGGVAGAARRGAALGAFAYATYDLTNWAVLPGWPVAAVPVEIAWGAILTSSVAAAARAATERLARRSGAA